MPPPTGYVLDEPQTAQADTPVSPEIKPPKGYQLTSSKSPAAPKKTVKPLKDVKAEAAKMKPVVPPKGYILKPTASVSAHTSSTLEQIRNSLANTAIGYSLEQALPRLADALHLHPSEKMGTPQAQQHKDQIIAPEYLTDTAMKVMGSVLPDAEKKIFNARENRERVEGALGRTGNLLSGENMATMAGTAVAAGLTAGVINPASANLLGRLVSGGFTADMLYGLYQQNKEYKQAVDSGDLSEAHKIQGAMGVDALMALTGLKHALTSHPFTPVTETPVRERTNVLLRNTAGEVRQAKGQAPVVWTSPAAWESLMGVMYPGEEVSGTHGFQHPADERLLGYANNPQHAANNPLFGEVQKLLAEAHKNADRGGIALAEEREYVPDLDRIDPKTGKVALDPKTGKPFNRATEANIKVMREELNHTWQARLAASGKWIEHLTNEAFTRMYHAIPSGMYEWLVKQGYSGHNSPVMVAEAAVHLMDGESERFGVTEDDAIDFLNKYFKEVTDQHGVKALEDLKHVGRIAEGAKAKAIGEHIRTNAGENNGTVSGVAAGGQGGAGQGVPQAAFNREKVKYDDEEKNLIQMARTAEGKVKLGADPAALGKILGSSLYKSAGPRVITKELVQNAMDAVRQSTGDKNVKVEIFNGAYPPSPTGAVVPHPDIPSSWAIQHPNGEYEKNTNRTYNGPVGTPIKWESSYDAKRRLHDLYPQTGTENAIRVTDTGKGMTKDELETVFTDLGASGKREQADASGGFGLAKAAPMMMSKKLEVSTVVNEGGKLMRHWFSATPEELLGSGVDIHSEVLPPNSAPTGTVVTSVVPAESEMYGASGFLREANRSLRPPGNIQIFQNGEEVNHKPEGDMGNPIDTRKVPGSDLDLYISDTKRPKPTSNYDSINAEIHNNGIFQFTKNISVPPGIRGFPSRVAVDVKATVPEGDPNYPFTANREQTHGEHVDKTIDELVKEKIIKPIVEKHNELIKKMYWNFPKIDGHIPLFDSGERMTPEEQQEIMSNPAVKEIADSIMDLTATAGQKLANAAENDYDISGLGARTKHVGIIMSDAVHGLHLTNPEDRNHATIFINPFDKDENSPDAYASLMWHTIQHELVHDKVSGHNESFTTAFKNTSRALGSMNIKALTELRSKYADPNDSTKIRPDFDRALQIYRESRSRPESTPDIFGGEESRTDVDRPAGKEGGGAGVPASGKGTVSDTLFNREKDKPTWYLKSERLLNEKMKGPAPAEDVHKMLLAGGVKEDEMKWTGLDDFLKGKKKVTPEEVKKHLAENNIQVQEVMKGNQLKVRPSEDYPGEYEVVDASGRVRFGAQTWDEAKEYISEEQELGHDGPKYARGDWVLPGGENHKELLLKLPPTINKVEQWQIIRPDGHVHSTFADEESAKQAMERIGKREEGNAGFSIREMLPIKTEGGFKSHAYDDPNILAWIRFNDRNPITYTPEDIKRIEAKIQEAMPSFGPKSWGSGATKLAVSKGLITPEEAAQYSHAKGWNNDTTGATNKLLHVEEIQSDWHQKGRTQGYKSGRAAELEKKIDAIREKYDSLERADISSDVDQIKKWRSEGKSDDEIDALLNHERTHRNVSTVRMADEIRPLQQELNKESSGVPDAPFKKTWHEMALRRMLKHAVENGYSGLSWTGGEDQAERYDLSKQIDNVTFTPTDSDPENTSGWLTATDKDGHRVIDEEVESDDLPDYIGKDATQKLKEKVKEWRNDAETHYTSHEDEETGKWRIEDYYGEPVYDRSGGLIEFDSPEDAADYIEHGKTENINHLPAPELSGLDLKVGGEGMKGFYDKIIPDYLNKFGKKFGAKVGETDIPIPSKISATEQVPFAVVDPEGKAVEHWNSEDAAKRDAAKRGEGFTVFDIRKSKGKPVQYLPITPEMRQSVAEEGVPLFNREVPKLKTDNPGGDWLKKKRQATEQDGRDTFGKFNRMGAVTGYSNDRYLVPVDVLKKIPGANGEQRMNMEDRARGIADNFRKTGRLPQVDGKDYHPFVMVDQEGKPWVNEGNHRIAGAALAGVKYLPVEVRFFNGGEQEKGVMSPDNLAQYHKTAIDQGYTPENYAERNKKDSNIAFNRENPSAATVKISGDTPKDVLESIRPMFTTPAQKDMFDWAYWPALDMAESEDAIDERKESGKSLSEDILDDLIYRLGEMIPEMAEDQVGTDTYAQDKARARVAAKMAERLEAAKTVLQKSKGDTAFNRENPSAAGQESKSLDSNLVSEGVREIPEPVVAGSTGTARTTVIPVQGGTKLASAPKQEPVVPVAKPVARVLPRKQIMVLAAGLNPNPSQPQVKSVRELMKEASKRNPTAMIP